MLLGNRKGFDALCFLDDYFLKFRIMKKIIMLLVMTLAVLNVFSQQSVAIDSRLYAKYQEEDLQNILSNDPSQIEYLNWMLDNAYVIKDINSPQANNFPRLKYFDKETKQTSSEVSEYNPESFNIMEFDFNIDYKKSNAYLIGNTGKLLVFFSGEDLTKLYNNYKNR